jgi:hypothetical protein
VFVAGDFALHLISHSWSHKGLEQCRYKIDTLRFLSAVIIKRAPPGLMPEIVPETFHSPSTGPAATSVAEGEVVTFGREPGFWAAATIGCLDSSRRSSLMAYLDNIVTKKKKTPRRSSWREIFSATGRGCIWSLHLLHDTYAGGLTNQAFCLEFALFGNHRIEPGRPQGLTRGV